MADDFTTNAGSGGARFHAVDDGTRLWPVGLCAWGATSGAVQIVDATHALPVQPGTGSTWAVTGTFWQATQPVSAAALPLPAGAATAANQTTELASLASIDGKTPALVGGLIPVTIAGQTGTPAVSVTGSVAVTGAFFQTTQPVSGTFWQATQPVSGTVTANAGTGTFTITGAVTQSGTWNIGTVTTVTGVTTVSTVTSLTQFNGNAIDTNSGSKSAGTLRVVLATDQPALTNAQPHTPTAGTAGGASMHNLPASAASTNATSVKASAGTVYGVQLFNTSAATKFLHLFDKASPPAVGTDAPVKTIPIPATANSVLGGVVLTFPVGLAFTLGIAYAITGAVGNSDTTPVAAGDVGLSIDYK